jgi:hypothetical protein
MVVFLDVYGAIWVDNYREQLDCNERTEQVVLALQQDLRDDISVTGGFHAHINSGLAAWEAAYRRGEKPPPYAFRIFGAEISPRTTWDVVLQSQLTDLLESNVLFELEFFDNEVTLGAKNTFATSNSP